MKQRIINNEFNKGLGTGLYLQKNIIVITIMKKQKIPVMAISIINYEIDSEILTYIVINKEKMNYESKI
jgi:hypothetical protein